LHRQSCPERIEKVVGATHLNALFCTFSLLSIDIPPFNTKYRILFNGSERAVNEYLAHAFFDSIPPLESAFTISPPNLSP